MSLGALLKRVVEALEEARVPYMLTGSLAAAYYATPRATQDIDVVIDPGQAGLEGVVGGFTESGYYVDRETAHAALTSRGQFTVIDPDSGWKVDPTPRKDRSFSATEFERRGTASLLGIEVSLAAPEDILLAKLEWAKIGGSDLQLGMHSNYSGGHAQPEPTGGAPHQHLEERPPHRSFDTHERPSEASVGRALSSAILPSSFFLPSASV